MDHLSDDQLEAYSMGRLPEAQVGPFEEHLLLCAVCQEALKAQDQYLLAMRTGLRLPVRDPAPLETGWRIGWQRLAWVGGLAAIVVGLWAIPYGSNSRTPVAVKLSSFRGTEQVAMAHAPAGSPLRLTIDSVAATPECRIEIVNEIGEPAWNGGLTVTPDGLHAEVEERLGAGHYWVRLYAPDASLLQEFALTLD